MAFDHDDDGPRSAEDFGDEVAVLRAMMRTLMIARKLAQQLRSVEAESLADLEATIGACELAILRLGEEAATPH